jgi:4-hydroxybenzoate polyprenyltransferase
MANSVYKVNKGINKSIEFKGLKAQYIWYLGGGVIVLLVVFAGLYIVGIHPYICIGIILVSGAVLIVKIYELSHKYGEHGMMKAIAKKGIPRGIKSHSRKIFADFKKGEDGKTAG